MAPPSGIKCSHFLLAHLSNTLPYIRKTSSTYFSSDFFNPTQSSIFNLQQLKSYIKNTSSWTRQRLLSVISCEYWPRTAHSSSSLHGIQRRLVLLSKTLGLSVSASFAATPHVSVCINSHIQSSIRSLTAAAN